MRPTEDGTLEWMDETPITADAWAIFEEAARLASIAKDNPEDLHLAGRIYGLATALQVMNRSDGADYGEGYDAKTVEEWVAFAESFAEDNYEHGRKCCK